MKSLSLFHKNKYEWIEEKEKEGENARRKKGKEGREGEREKKKFCEQPNKETNLLTSINIKKWLEEWKKFDQRI